MNISNYTKDPKYFARNLRKDGTPGEIVLWSEVLRARKFYGLQFNRQFSIANYIVDFICRKLKLIIEVDGYSHQHKVENDELRDKRLKELGYTVIRIDEGEIRRNLNNSIKTIEAFLPDEILNHQSPYPLFKGGKSSE